jgi:Protein of unknown function (DUF3500)
LGLALICLALKPAQERTTTSRIVSAANAFLSTLDDKQRQAVLYSFEDEEQRKRWSNFPAVRVPRGGINLKQMSAPQRAAVMGLLSIVLSPLGFEKINQIRMADDAFKVNEFVQQHQAGGPFHGNGGAPPPMPGPTAQRPTKMAQADLGAVNLPIPTIFSAAISTTSPFWVNLP